MTLDELKFELEKLLDSETPERVFDALADVCLEKSEHVTSVWADSARARDWQYCADRLSKAASRANEGCL